MKRLLNLGVSNPLTLGMAHPVADRIETLGRARPTTWRSRCLALSAMAVIALSTAPITTAESVSRPEVNTSHTITVIPDMTDTQISDLKSRLDKLSSGQADKSVINQFMWENNDQFVGKYDAEDKYVSVTFGMERLDQVKEVLAKMPEWLERCKTEKVNDRHVMRANLSFGSASVQCVALQRSKPKVGQEKQ